MDVIHNSKEHFFYIKLNEADKAHIAYRLMDKNTVDFCSTFVPSAFRGKGHAGVLVSHAIKWAEENALSINASCSYVAKVLSRKSKVS